MISKQVLKCLLLKATLYLNSIYTEVILVCQNTEYKLLELILLSDDVGISM